MEADGLRLDAVEITGFYGLRKAVWFMKVLELSRMNGRWRTIAFLLFAAALLAAPLFLSDFRLSLLAKFLTYAILAIGLDLIWGYTGILSLGHGVFFGIGAYAMAMHLKLEATGGRLPDFMQWSGVDKLPWFWQPFHSFGMAVLLGIALPMLFAALLGFFTFRNRIRGVYFTILTQALVIITTTLLIGQQGYTGGTNGITSFSTVLGQPIRSPEMRLLLYWITAIVLIGVFLGCRRLVTSRFGQVLKAIRDGEDRTRFLGYNPAAYKIFVFSLSAGIAGIAGMLFVFHVGIIAPSMISIVPSIEMALWVAIGGRGTLIGAVIGALSLNWGKSLFSEAYPDMWQYFLGLMLIVVVVFLPRGIVGAADRVKLLITRRRYSDERASGKDMVAGESGG